MMAAAEKSDTVLVADIGGTKTRVGLARRVGNEIQLDEEWLFPSDPSRSLEELISTTVLPEHRQGRRGVFAIAGPLRHAQVQMTNLPWEISAAELGAKLGLAELRLLNDVEAMAWCLTRPGAGTQLKAGQQAKEGHRALLSLGTGLGEGGALYSRGRYHPWAGEGGHGDFSPASELEWELQSFIRQRRGLDHLSRERVLSGAGLVNCGEFLLERKGGSLQRFLSPSGGEAVVQIHRAAREGSDTACVEALELFVYLLGAEAGNLALESGATGGLYLGGGMALKLEWALRGENFLRGFLSKGRFRSYLELIPVFLLQDERAPLLGAAWCALS